MVGSQPEGIPTATKQLVAFARRRFDEDRVQVAEARVQDAQERAQTAGRIKTPSGSMTKTGANAVRAASAAVAAEWDLRREVALRQQDVLALTKAVDVHNGVKM